LGTKISQVRQTKQLNDQSNENLNMMKNGGVKLAFSPKLEKQKFGS
jgi:hypothetical protein